jgi:hypothetical protein
MTDNFETTTTEATATSFPETAYQVTDQVANAVATAFTGNRIEQIAHRAANWHATVYATSNDMLYAILQDGYAYYEGICRGGEPGKKLKEELEAYCVKQIGKYNKDDHTLTSIVKCVFGYNANNRKRISGYSIALRAAAEAKQTSQNIAKFIKDAGGIEELRLAQAKSGMSTADKVEAAKAAVSNNKLATISDAAVTAKLDKGKHGELVVLIAEQLPNGELSVKAVIEKQSVVEAALTAYYTANRKQLKAQEEVNTTVAAGNSIAASVDAAIEEAIQQLAA